MLARGAFVRCLLRPSSWDASLRALVAPEGVSLLPETSIWPGLSFALRKRAIGDDGEPAPLPVVYQDEGGSTAQVSDAAARRRDRPRNASSVHPARRRVKPRVDDLAAAVILQSYLDTRVGES